MSVQVGDIYQVQAVGRCFGQRIIMTHNYRVRLINDDVSESALRNEVALAVSAGILGGDVLETTYLALLPEQYVLNYWRAQVISPVRRAYMNLNRNVNGTAPGDALTVNCGAGITLRSDFVGRHEHCTKHIGPIAEDVGTMQSGLLTAEFKAKCILMIGSYVSSIVIAGMGATLDPVIYNRGQVINWAAITVGFVGDTVRTQRRRTVGLGE